MKPIRRIQIPVDFSAHSEEAIRLAADLSERYEDLIVMGTHDRTGLKHLFMGSVAERFVRLATGPVLTTKTDGAL